MFSLSEETTTADTTTEDTTTADTSTSTTTTTTTLTSTPTSTQPTTTTTTTSLSKNVQTSKIKNFFGVWIFVSIYLPNIYLQKRVGRMLCR